MPFFPPPVAFFSFFFSLSLLLSRISTSFTPDLTLFLLNQWMVKSLQDDCQLWYSYTVHCIEYTMYNILNKSTTPVPPVSAHGYAPDRGGRLVWGVREGLCTDLSVIPPSLSPCDKNYGVRFQAVYALSCSQSFLRSRPSNLQTWAAKHGPFGCEKYEYQLELENEHDSQPLLTDR